MYETRSVRETAWESSAFSLVILILVFLPVLGIAGTKGVTAAIKWTVAAGRLALTPDGGHLTRENVHHGKSTSGVHS